MKIFSILSRPGTSPPGEGQQILKTCRISGFIFLCYANVLHNLYTYYYTILVLIENICKGFD